MKIYETLETGITIVEYEPSLAPALAEFWNICGQEEDGDWGGDSGISTAGQIIAQHETASHFNVYVALDGEVAVGYCSFGRYYYDANTAYVALLGVRPDYRSKKIGKALVLRCVQRTIELGYPRLDLFTWGGNTAAVPLYKKCGFLWEDRPDGTHLANFMPTILTTPLFSEFFAKADWYADSKRSLEIEPDGKKVNGFELFEYAWEKDSDTLKIGYERSGRQMNMLETNDYKIQLVANSNPLAFGTEYNCTFEIENKTGKELNIKINGREDGNITLDCGVSTQVTGKQQITAKFFVGPVEKPQDEWKVHPCILADVEINGKTVVFGLGINAKFPLMVEFKRDCTVDQVGMGVKTYVNITSALAEDATVTIDMPKNKILDLGAGHTITIPAKGNASIPLTATTLALGYEKLEMNCTAVLASGKTLNFTVPAFVATRDMVTAFAASNLTSHSIFNGSWGLTLNTEENEVDITHLTNKGYNSHGAFDPPKLGKPYNDEFNLIAPAIKTYAQGSAIVMETEYVSENFAGLVVTQIYTLHATGLITRTSRVENRGQKSRATMLQDSYGLELGYNSVFSYNGQITQNKGALLTGFENTNVDGINENWVFENNPSAPMGYFWPEDYKPVVNWGTNLSFEIDLGELAPGASSTTKPVTFAFGLFANYNDLRNYARQVKENEVHGVLPLEVELNGYNPFVTAPQVKLHVINNRDEVQEGTITVNAGGISHSQSNPHEDIVERNSFDLALNPAENISTVSVAMGMVGYEKHCHKAIFFPKGEIQTLQNGTNYTVSNGAITFHADPAYGHGCYALSDSQGQEWLFNQYPEHKPYSWFNPFLGGIRLRFANDKDYMIDDRAMLKEKISAEFVKLQDNFGNHWQGICTTLSINDNEAFKGTVYKSYFLTQPGLPVLCSFFKLENNTGLYQNNRTWLSAIIRPDSDAKNVMVEVTAKDGTTHRRRMGSLETADLYYEGEMKITSSRAQKMYCICSSKNAELSSDFWGSNKICIAAAAPHAYARAANGETFTSNPSFMVITDKELPKGALADLEQIRF